MKVLHLIESLSLRNGGPSRTSTNLCKNLKKCDVEVNIIHKYDGEDFIDISRFLQQHTYFPRSSSSDFLQYEFYNFIKSKYSQNKYNIVHSHGIWKPLNYFALKLTHEQNLPHVVHTRGMLEAWSLNQSSLKKKLAGCFFQDKSLNNADLLVATSYQELNSIRNYGITSPVAMIPNGIELPDLSKKDPIKKNKKILFLSRIHPKKGIINMIKAFSKSKNQGWELIIAGPNENNHLKEVQSHINKFSVNNNIRYIGEVYGENKKKAYVESDAFILPSFSENFGVVVAEALSYGLPVIASRGTPWQSIQENKCGWWVEPIIDDISNAFNKLFTSTNHELEIMSNNARLHSQEFLWSEIAIKTKMSYSWILGKEKKPNFVYTT